ncbi:high-affinity nicotinic acid transporter [Trichomonascus vanleenenianus]|uniref:high-affinity nicotinic acid transporter n=1 Tax=Trichomonascus vanleenenianus TaxID=2268995 RepID=UPI003ECAE838
MPVEEIKPTPPAAVEHIEGGEKAIVNPIESGDKAVAEHYEGGEKDLETAVVYSAVELEYTEEEERKLLRKYDWNILSFVSVLYLLSYLDRGNIGNANTAGMSADTGMSDSQYEWLLTIFYITYILFQWLTLMWKVFPPRWYVPFMVISWGIISSCNAAGQNWAGFMVLRALMGIFEAGFGPGVPYYLTFFYYRHEVTWRTGIFLAVSPLASAFAGALAYGITYNPLAIASWRVLFLVEGLPTIAVGLIAVFYPCVPNSPSECRFLTERQKQIAHARTVKQVGKVERDHKLDFKELGNSLVDPKNLIPSIMFFSINVSFSSLPVFLPAILKGMGFTSVNAQGLSAPPYVVTCILTAGLSYLSDKWLQRGLILSITAAVGAAGFLILALADNLGVRYFAVYLATAGVFPCVPILIAWVGNNQRSDSARGMGFVILQAVGQCGPLLGTRIFPSSDGPMYRKGMWISFGFLCLVSALGLVLRFYYVWLNKKLEEKFGADEEHRSDHHDEIGMEGRNNVHYRYIY